MQATDDTIQQAKMVGERIEREPRKSWIHQGFHQDGESACGGIYLVLTANVPHGERNVLVLYSLDVESDGWDGCHNLSKLQLVKNGGLTCAHRVNSLTGAH